ncbi:MAG: mannose-1-phosphate guanylyltransferase [Gemmatimonadota bacterium]|jgi:mannose-1-phosphate guanylyltransferase|nr:mannose-1-phosphate guanylyltransferase [Gemmatimonadota bacterium]MDP7031494.1 mannose-1-phosphate guanylyltransferase [Gemmatimonadota bacterium]
MSTIHAVIMAGGRGTRFWPESRTQLPKQFLAVAGGDSLLTRTGKRLFPLTGEDRVWVVTSAAHVDLVAGHLPQVARTRIVGEPVGRNTAPCAGVAAALAAREDPEAVLLVAPADHWIGDEDRFRAAVQDAAAAAQETRGLVTFGILPTSPETGFGYIERGEAATSGVSRVARFTEKPDRATAEGFLAGGRHYWNSGIFCWRADVFMEELARYRPELAAACERIAAAEDTAKAMEADFPSMESVSVDYAVLEPSERVFVLPADFAWSDVGSWDSLPDILPRDESGNSVSGDALVVDSTNCLVRSPGRFTAVVGMTGTIVVDTGDALLVCPRDRCQDVRRVVDALEQKGRRELL